MTDSTDDPSAEPEHDLVVRLRLGNRAIGTAAERKAIDELAAQLEDAVAAAGAGEYDGDELGGGECRLFFAGPDADRLFTVLQPLLHRHPLGRAATVTLQYGGGELQTRRL